MRKWMRTSIGFKTMELPEPNDKYIGKWVRIYGKNSQFGGKVNQVRNGSICLSPFVMHTPEDEQKYTIRTTGQEEINEDAIEGVVELTEEEVVKHIAFLNNENSAKNGRNRF